MTELSPDRHHESVDSGAGESATAWGGLDWLTLCDSDSEVLVGITPGNVAAQFVAAGLIDEMIVAFRAVCAR